MSLFPRGKTKKQTNKENSQGGGKGSELKKE